MISIINVSEKNQGSRPDKYIIKINREVIGEFYHYRSKGLIACLRDCANSLDAKYDHGVSDSI